MNFLFECESSNRIFKRQVPLNFLNRPVTLNYVFSYGICCFKYCNVDYTMSICVYIKEYFLVSKKKALQTIITNCLTVFHRIVLPLLIKDIVKN